MRQGMPESRGRMETDMLTRRRFVYGLTAAGVHAGVTGCITSAGRTNVGHPWEGWKPGHFQIHAIYTGVAESLFLIFPDSTSLLIDCGDHAACERGELAVPILPDPSRHSGEWIARYVQRVNPRGCKVDYMLLSHYHSDHAGCLAFHAGKSPNGRYCRSGFGQAMEWLSFGTAIDRAWPTFDDPLPMPDGFNGGVVAHMREVYAELSRRGTKIERFRLERGSSQIRPLHGHVDEFYMRPLCANGRILMPDGSVRDLYGDLIASGKMRRVNENAMSIGMVFEYGMFRFYTAGDFADRFALPGGLQVEAEDVMAEACGAADVAKVNHHGHHSMQRKLVAALKSSVYLACIWDQLHVTCDTMRRLSDRNAYPGDRVLAPGILSKERRVEDYGEDWMQDVAQGVFEGAHVIVDVAPGGGRYSVITVSAKDESMTVTSDMEFISKWGVS